jgi:hypothetical protein
MPYQCHDLGHDGGSLYSILICLFHSTPQCHGFCHPSLGRAGQPTTPDNTVMEGQLGISTAFVAYTPFPGAVHDALHEA